jgi:hypothetical protein
MAYRVGMIQIKGLLHYGALIARFDQLRRTPLMARTDASIPVGRMCAGLWACGKVTGNTKTCEDLITAFEKWVRKPSRAGADLWARQFAQYTITSENDHIGGPRFVVRFINDSSRTLSSMSLSRAGVLEGARRALGNLVIFVFVLADLAEAESASPDPLVVLRGALVVFRGARVKKWL